MRRHVNMVADIGLLRWSTAQQNWEDKGRPTGSAD
jgi:hypothetical protein